MELVFDHSPITEGLSTLSGEPEADVHASQDSPEQAGQAEEAFFTARPVVVELKMECFAHSDEQLADDDDRLAPVHHLMHLDCEYSLLDLFSVRRGIWHDAQQPHFGKPHQFTFSLVAQR